tara:strand:+ start:251 stop:703 length:453 start_codon:yes stop_codon:yes gene_type:complete
MNSKLHKYHKKQTKNRWKGWGLLWTSEEEFDEIYQRVITSTQCELCNKPFNSNQDKQMDHEHCIDNKWGWFRNVVCRSCNLLRSDKKIRSDNKSGYVGIHKHLNKAYKHGFIWEFEARLNGKQKTIKSSTNKEWLIDFATQWKIDNNYNT